MAIGVAALVVAGSWNLRAAAGNAGPEGNADTLGFDVSHMDKTCKPCDDFFQYVNGNWIKNNPIPPEYASWGSGSMLHDNNQKQLRTLLDEAAANTSAATGSSERKVGDFYASCMDTTSINAAGAKPLDAEFARIAAFQDKGEVATLIAHLHSQTVGALFGFGSTQDLKDSSKVIGEADQGGLGLPDRDYYTRTDDDSKKLREKYLAHMTKMLTLLGDSQEKAAAQAKTVLDIETSLAGASFTNVQLRDPETQYHILTVAQLGELTPHFSWSSYFAALGHPELKEINIGQPDFFKELDKQIATRSTAELQAYLRYHLLSRTASTLSEPFVEENFDFNARTLAGLEGAAAAMEALRGFGGHLSRRSTWAALRGEIFPARSQGAGAGHGEEPARGVAGRHSNAVLDESGDQESGAGEAGSVQREDGLSGKVARLFGAENRSRVVRAEHAAGFGI